MLQQGGQRFKGLNVGYALQVRGQELSLECLVSRPHFRHPIVSLSHCAMSFILARSATLSRALPLIVPLVTLLFLAPIVFPCI